jgi:hypothetical protein
MTPDFKPQFTVKATGHVVAEFTCERTSSNIGLIFEWIKREQWKGCLQINFAGNGGVCSIRFAESPKPLRDTPEIN